MNNLNETDKITIASLLIESCLEKLIQLKKINKDQVKDQIDGRWKIKFDTGKLDNKKLRGATQGESNGRCIIYLHPKFSTNKELMEIIAHEVIHLGFVKK